ncbi:uncharacterized protein LOC128987418 isoform X1 [Macrosteles quadrilineatus]|uniref:uncharacterized protein LOC128987418 isoform X1 n=1 Tax=Macrosteles quadrilineatus TaxID=74068 RepID=UPI0023E10137|nr:uncharacterized protein LOC128987418 isoform X1 [Macrosteles quadrilineatus]
MTTIKLPFLKKFCCCMELVTGVRVVTGFALVLGDFYIVMGATLYDDFYPTLVLASAVSYYISGGLYCLWFLFLLLFQTSTSSRYARTVMLVHTKVLMVWLLVVIILLALSVHALSRYKHVSVYEKEKQLIYFGILSAISAFVMTTYSLWILESYIYCLEVDEASTRTTSHIPEEGERFESNENQLLQLDHEQSEKLSINDLQMKLSNGNVESENVRLSQISVLSDSNSSIMVSAEDQCKDSVVNINENKS